MKELIIFIVTLGITMTQFLQSMPDKTSPDWYCFGADSWHTCFMPESAGPKTTKIEQKWRIEKGTSGKPTVVDNKVYLGMVGGISCLDANTGKTLWHTGTSGACCRQVLYHEDRLYVNS